MDKYVIIRPESGLQYDWKSIAQNPSGHYEPKMDLVAYKALYINAGCDQFPMLLRHIG